MSRTSKRLRSIVITVIAVAATNFAISLAGAGPSIPTRATQELKSGNPILPNAPRPKSGNPILPNAPRPKSGNPILPNAPRP